MSNVDSSYERLRECSERRAQLEQQYKDFKSPSNYPESGNWNDYHREEMRLSDELKEARQAEHEAQMEYDKAKNDARKDYEKEQEQTLSETNGNMNDKYWENYYAREYEQKQQEGRENYDSWQDEIKREADNSYEMDRNRSNGYSR